MKEKKEESVQDWNPVEEILEQGIIKLKNGGYIKIIKVIPINFNLKSELEKESILNSYKIFLKTCNFDMQIIIQSCKEDLNPHIIRIKNQEKDENEKIRNIAENYIEYIKELNQSKKSSNKNFYIILKKSKEKEIEEIEKIIFEELNENYFKAKECLSRCGNIVKDINTKEQIEEILFSFLNRRAYLQK